MARIGRRGLAAVVLVIAAIVSVVYVRDLVDDDSRPTVTARFSGAAGVYEDSPVRIRGVRVGRVAAIEPKDDAVEVRLELDRGVRLPANVNAWIMSPSIIAERFVELGPSYTGGEELASGGEIPLTRTHEPVSWDQLIGSVDILADTFGGRARADADALRAGTQVLSENSGDLRRIVDSLARAGSVTGARADDIGTLIDNLQVIMDATGATDGRIRELVAAFVTLSGSVRQDDLAVGAALGEINGLLDELDRVSREHGQSLGRSVEAMREVSERLGRNRAELAEIIDLLPLVMQNIDDARAPDGRIRIRLNVSTNLMQLDRMRELCRAHPNPLCFGTGLTNPVQFPLSQSDPLGIRTALERLAEVPR